MEGIQHFAWQDTTNFFSPEYLHVNSSGRQNCNGRAFSLLRENGRVDYHILYIIKGYCTLQYAGQKRTLLPGDGVLYKPGERQEYAFPADTDTSTFWVHFSGSAIEGILKNAGFWDNCFFRLQQPQQTEMLFEELVREQQFKQFQYTLMCNSLLLRILGHILRDTQMVQTQAPIAGILPALSAMHDHPEENMDIQTYANMCHLSKSRFIHLFTAFTGASPHHYRLNLRVHRAKELLAYSSMSIAEVSTTVGFADPLYFSRIFRKYTDLSPTQYRREKKSGK